jgi:beta-glucanase (GH16 family)
MTAAAFLAALLLAQPAAPVANNYRIDEAMARPADARLVWSDEFDGPALDPARWSYDTARNREGWYNGELQYYAAGRPENVRVADGHLIIEARREELDPAHHPDWGGQHYTSGRILTRGHASWTYGWFEVRAKLPCARGTWPAIWMLPDTGAWPAGGEIDVMEMVGSEPEIVHATLHSALFVHTRGTQRGAAMPLPGACGAFHLYQLDWRPDSITIGVDGHAYLRVRNDQPGGRGAWPFDAPFHLILNLAMGGAWAAARGMDDAALPQLMEVDYVRVWQAPH